MGVAIGAEAVRRGAHVVLVLGPSALEPPRGAEVVRVRSAAEMHQAVMTRAPGMDAIVMAAAVADYTVAGGAQSEKISKHIDGPQGDAEDSLTVTLTRTADILADLGRWRADSARPVLVGFAAETEDVVASATAKLTRKRGDLVVANDVSRSDTGFEVETNAAVLIDAAGATELPLQLKTELAGAILGRVETRLRNTDTADRAVPASTSASVEGGTSHGSS